MSSLRTNDHVPPHSTKIKFEQIFLTMASPSYADNNTVVHSWFLLSYLHRLSITLVSFC